VSHCRCDAEWHCAECQHAAQIKIDNQHHYDDCRIVIVKQNVIDAEFHDAECHYNCVE
jgi:hypothetical protein